MKILGLTLAVLALSCSNTPVHAQQEAQAISADEVPQSIESVTVSARRFHMEPQEFMYFEASYRLSNGHSVTFSRRVRRFYVAIKGQPGVEIFATAADQFVTKAGATLVFSEAGEALDINHYELLQRESGLPLAVLSEAPK